ncbi:Hypothetical predicted protein [Mytilus galloprovincialis]|uniref:Uncharacterized protein n=1 Tax=Mytilus galloprovincialis TaxID=29158 RepID=A0A8B6DLJ1_MYTGA|nr:Hypothetical predicted protein [Mytilus galloprovincialis]
MKGGDSDETYSTTPLNIKKRRRRKSSRPSPSSQVEDKRQRTNSEISSESDTDSESEQSDCNSRGKDEMSNPSDLLPKVPLTEIDIENKTRQIIARFPKHDLKVEILKSAKKLREIPGLQDICINQDLTKTRDEIAFQARAYVRNHRLKATWVVDGKIMAIGKDNKNTPSHVCMI